MRCGDREWESGSGPETTDHLRQSMTNRNIQTTPVWPIIGANVLAAMCVAGMLTAWWMSGYSETGAAVPLAVAALCLLGGGVAAVDFSPRVDSAKWSVGRRRPVHPVRVRG